MTDFIAGDTTVPVVPAATAAVFRGKAIDLRAIGREHDVHFALTGNARRQDGRLIVAVTLYETVDVQQVWSQRFDRPDSPDERDAIIAVIDSNVDLATNDAEVARAMREHPNDLDKRDLMFAQDTTALRTISKANNLAQIALSVRPETLRVI